MDIAIDAREAAGSPTGVGRYLINLLRFWHGEQLTLYFDERQPTALPGDDDALRKVHLPRWPEMIPGRDTLWQQLTLPRQLRRRKPDVFFSPAYSLPPRLPCPSLVTVHDISFETHPHWFPRRQGMRRRLTCRQSCRRADLVLTVSEFSRRQIVRCYDLPPEKVVAVPNAADPLFRPMESESAAQQIRRCHNIRGRIILHAGSILNRRMIPLLLESFSQVLKTDPRLTLVFAGENRSWPAIDLFVLATKYGVDDRVAALGFVSDQDLATLYNASALTVYLSEYEGFGLPPLEALASGCPALTSTGTALEENFSGLASLYAGREPGELAQLLLEQLARSAEESWEDRLQRSRRAGERFSWERTAGETLYLIRQTAGAGMEEA